MQQRIDITPGPQGFAVPKTWNIQQKMASVPGGRIDYGEAGMLQGGFRVSDGRGRSGAVYVLAVHWHHSFLPEYAG